MFDATNACLQVVGRVAPAMVAAVGSSGNVAGALHMRYRVASGLLKVATAFLPRAIIDEEEAVAELLFRLVSVLLPCLAISRFVWVGCFPVMRGPHQMLWYKVRLADG